MKTIFITIDWFLPAYKAGGPVQSIANLVEQYQQPETRFRILCGNTDLDGSELAGVAFDCWTSYNDCTQVWYASKKSTNVKTIRREIKDSGATVLFIIGIYSWYFNIVPLLFGDTKMKILSARGMLHPGALSQKGFKKRIYLALLKLSGVQQRCTFHATDDTEAGFIQAAFGNQTNVLIAGNYPRIFSWQQASEKKAGVLKMVSIALISPMKNILLVLQALQHCRLQVDYDIYGPVKDQAYWQQCVALIRNMPDNIRVQFKGAIEPAQTAATLGLYEVVVLPSKSENFGHALFEALSAGKPVITSHFTPFNELQLNKAGKNVSIENALEITAAVDTFAAMSATEFSAWNKGAHVYAIKQVDLAVLKKQYDGMFGGEVVNGES
ncbi:glycosyltransferase [Ferruginibacter paludis]|uniref:glycosyltransferase n=1 Tax=Ferruginibacter paludis TaxID=1310417 RepID=UPI0025B32D68|nr:glycosyltransferase [Ferruginibacter paludis]MDN3655853.1 glycosyltransferase [Ferruginibacter paludis]